MTTAKTTTKRYRGTQTVGPGFYVNLRRLTFASFDEEEGRLPGLETETWRRVPELAMLAAAPFVSIAYIVFLPLIGFLMLGGVLASKLSALARQAAGAAVPVLRPAWQPARAFLTRGKPRKAGEAEEVERDEWAEVARREAAADDDGDEPA